MHEGESGEGETGGAGGSLATCFPSFKLCTANRGPKRRRQCTSGVLGDGPGHGASTTVVLAGPGMREASGGERQAPTTGKGRANIARAKTTKTTAAEDAPPRPVPTGCGQASADGDRRMLLRPSHLDLWPLDASGNRSVVPFTRPGNTAVVVTPRRTCTRLTY
jgi:hypothetical protein